MRGVAAVLVRSRGALWAFPAHAIEGLQTSGREIRLLLPGGEVACQEVVTLVGELPIQPAGKIFRAFWRQPCLGLSLWQEEPVVVLRADAPPALLSP